MSNRAATSKRKRPPQYVDLTNENDTDEQPLPMERGKKRTERFIERGERVDVDFVIGALQVDADVPIATIDDAKLLEMLQIALPAVDSVHLKAWVAIRHKAHQSETSAEFLNAALTAEFPDQTSQNSSQTRTTDRPDQRSLKEFVVDDSVERLPDNHVDIVLGNAICCGICFDYYNMESTLPCSKSEEHTLCKRCFGYYILSKASSDSLSTIECAYDACDGRYDKLVAEAYLPAGLCKRMDTNQLQVDQRVALATGNVAATLYCECGVVAVVEREHVGDNTVTCCCGRTYCIKCGNFVHPAQPCPLPRETIKWMGKHKAKRCPNCGTGIEKTGGCTHMTCRTCKHEFCWLCLGPWRGHTPKKCRDLKKENGVKE